MLVPSWSQKTDEDPSITSSHTSGLGAEKGLSLSKDSFLKEQNVFSGAFQSPDDHNVLSLSELGPTPIHKGASSPASRMLFLAWQPGDGSVGRSDSAHLTDTPDKFFCPLQVGPADQLYLCPQQVSSRLRVAMAAVPCPEV